MKHYVDNLSVDPIVFEGVRTATFSKTQRTWCGLTISVEKRSDFNTSVQGMCGVDCPACNELWQERINRKFDCDWCKKDLDRADILELSPMDYSRACLKCREEGKHEKSC